MNSSSYRVEFQHKKAKIYDGSSVVIGNGDQARRNFFYLDLCDNT